MNVNQLIEQLYEFNRNAEVHVVVSGQPEPFSLSFGCSDGVTKETAEEVCFMVNTDCENDQ